MLCRRANRSEVVNLSVILLFGKLLFVQFCWSPPHGGRELKRERIDLILNFFSSPPSRGRELKPLCYYYSKFVKEVRHHHGGREL